MTALAEMRRLRDEIKARLERNDDYRALIALDAAISQIEGARVEHAPRPTARPRQSGRRSYADVTYEFITGSGRPVTTPAALDVAVAEGVADRQVKTNNFASSLSRDPRLVSITFEGERHWWLAGSPPPGGLSFEGAEGPADQVEPSAGAQGREAEPGGGT